MAVEDIFQPIGVQGVLTYEVRTGADAKDRNNCAHVRRQKPDGDGHLVVLAFYQQNIGCLLERRDVLVRSIQLFRGLLFLVFGGDEGFFFSFRFGLKLVLTLLPRVLSS